MQQVKGQLGLESACLRINTLGWGTIRVTSPNVLN